MSYKDPLFGSAADYNKTFLSTYKDYETVPYQAAQASAAVQVWADAFKRAQSFDTEKLRDTIAATDLDTFYGQIKFWPAGNNIAKPMVLRQIQDGKYNVVAPSQVGFAQAGLPAEARRQAKPDARVDNIPTSERAGPSGPVRAGAGGCHVG